jgi:hypothetical protein
MSAAWPPPGLSPSNSHQIAARSGVMVEMAIPPDVQLDRFRLLPIHIIESKKQFFHTFAAR